MLLNEAQQHCTSYTNSIYDNAQNY